MITGPSQRQPVSGPHRPAMPTGPDAARRRGQIHSGPYETEQQVREEPAVSDVYAAFDADPGPGKMTPHCARILDMACTAARIELGAYDRRILAWLAPWGPETCTVIASLILRASTIPDTAADTTMPGSLLITARLSSTHVIARDEHTGTLPTTTDNER